MNKYLELEKHKGGEFWLKIGETTLGKCKLKSRTEQWTVLTDVLIFSRKIKVPTD